MDIEKNLKRKAVLSLKKSGKLCTESFDTEALKNLGIGLLELYSVFADIQKETMKARVFPSRIDFFLFRCADIIDFVDLIVSEDTSFGTLDNLYDSERCFILSKRDVVGNQ